jgi:sugar/nucleoside kinase (ribokinase family)
MAVKPHYDILIPGNYFCDIIFTGIPSFPALGKEIYTQDVAVVPGGVMNSVIGLRRLGVNVGWIGNIGNDFFSHFAWEEAVAEGVDTTLLTRHPEQQLRRVTVSLSYPNDRAFITYVDPVPEVVDMALEALDQATFSHLHFSGLVVDERLPGLIQTCHSRGIQVSMDCQYREETVAMPLLREILSSIDLFMPNATEAQRITGTETLGQAFDVLTEIVQHIVVKDGANGAIALWEGQRYHEPGLSLAVIDTTGAGDVFNAGFLAAHLQGHHVRECLRWGNFCGGMSTLGRGGATNAPTLAQLQSWLAEQNEQQGRSLETGIPGVNNS